MLIFVLHLTLLIEVLQQMKILYRGTFFGTPCIWKAYVSQVNLSYLEPILVHPTRRYNFAGKLLLHLYNI